MYPCWLKAPKTHAGVGDKQWLELTVKKKQASLLETGWPSLLDTMFWRRGCVQRLICIQHEASWNSKVRKLFSIGGFIYCCQAQLDARFMTTPQSFILRQAYHPLKCTITPWTTMANNCSHFFQKKYDVTVDGAAWDSRKSYWLMVNQTETKTNRKIAKRHSNSSSLQSPHPL